MAGPAMVSFNEVVQGALGEDFKELIKNTNEDRASAFGDGNFGPVPKRAALAFNFAHEGAKLL